MSSNKMQKISAEETFRRMFPQVESTQAENTQKAETKENPASTQQDKQVASPAQPPKRAYHRDEPRDGNLKSPKGFKIYLTEELDNALARRCYRDRSKNRSGHVREALMRYLRDDIAAIRKEQG